MSSEKVNDENLKPNQEVTSSDQDESLEVDDAQLDGALAEVDELLAEEDPTFLSKMLEISGDKNINTTDLEVADVAGKVKYSLWLRIMFIVLPGSKYIFLGQRKIRAQLQILRLSRKSPKELAKETAMSVLKWCKLAAVKLMTKIKYFLFYFRALSNRAKLLFIGLILFTGASSYFLVFTYKRGILPAEKDPFILSLADAATAVYRFDKVNGQEYFYDSLRVAQNLMFLPKTVVNIRQSARSGSNPMMAFEIFLEGTTSDVMVEFKDREPEMKDIIQRTSEEMSYDQMDSEDGKRLLTRKLRIAVNAVLTTGRIKNIYYKTFVLKR